MTFETQTSELIALFTACRAAVVEPCPWWSGTIVTRFQATRG